MKRRLITSAKCQRAMDAMVALLETRQLDYETEKALNDACDALRKYRDGKAAA